MHLLINQIESIYDVGEDMGVAVFLNMDEEL